MKRDTWWETYRASLPGLKAQIQAKEGRVARSSEHELWTDFWGRLARDFPETRAEALGESLVSATAADTTRKRATEYHVAVDGSSAGAGTPENPFATLQQARDAIRSLKKRGPLRSPVRVVVHGGTYFLEETLVLGPEDSGAEGFPVIYESAPGERAVLSAGRVISTPWKSDDGRIFYTDIPQSRSKTVSPWRFRQLFVNENRAVLARYPNLVPEDVSGGGWLRAGDSWTGRILSGLSAGGWVEYKVDIPREGDYDLWVGIATRSPSIQDCFKLTIDGHDRPLGSMVASGHWRTLRFSRVLRQTHLRAGSHTMRWECTGRASGGEPGASCIVHLGAFVFTDNQEMPAPDSGRLPTPAPGEARVVIQAEDEEARVRGFSTTGFRLFPVSHGRDKIFHETASRRAGWASARQAEVMVLPGPEWYSAILRLRTAEPSIGLLVLDGAEQYDDIRSGNRFYAFNIREELDQPGEWYLDYETGRLSYWPHQGRIEGLQFVAPALTRLVEIRGAAGYGARAEQIVFRGFEFRDTDYSVDHPALRSSLDASFLLENAWFCAVERCRFVNTGGYAIRLSYDSWMNRILENEMSSMGAGGITLTGPTLGRRKGILPCAGGEWFLSRAAPACNLIGGNHIRGGGVYKKYVSGIHMDNRPANMALAPGNVCHGNRIHHMPRNGIFGFKNQGGFAIQSNYIHDVMLESDDGGAIHICTDNWETAPAVIEGNRIENIRGYRSDDTGPTKARGVYLDDRTSNVRVRTNAILNTSGGSVVLKGKNLTVENNILTGDRFCSIWLCDNEWGTTFVKRNVFDFSKKEAFYVHIESMVGQWPEPAPAHFDQNIIWGGNRPVRVSVEGGGRAFKKAGLSSPQIMLPEWRSLGFDQHSIAKDPLFIDRTKPWLGLHPDSPAFEVGFQPLDVLLGHPPRTGTDVR